MATITGSTGDDVLVGTEGNDVYTGFTGGHDILFDTGGFDTLYVDVNFNPAMWDGVDVSVMFTLSDNDSLLVYGADGGGDDWPLWVEKLVFNDYLVDWGSDVAEARDYSALAHGAEFYGLGGNDTIVGSNFADWLEGNNGDDLIQAGAGDDSIWWGDSDGNDTIDGGAGYDVLELSGNLMDYWNVDAEPLVEADDFDEVSGSFSLYYRDVQVQVTGVEKVIADWGVAQIGTQGDDVLAGVDGLIQNEWDMWEVMANDTLVGRAGNDSLRGGAGDDVLDGGTGNDTLVGGSGDDAYLIDSVGDVVSDSGGVDDVVVASIDWSLGAGIEHLILEEGARVGNGNGLNNYIEGNAGNNTLSGGGGDDTLAGGAGNDAYYVNGALDLVIDDQWHDYDVVFSTVDVDLNGLSGGYAPNVNKVVLQGSANLSAADTSFWDNEMHLVGNSGANLLNGYDGDDILNGGAGADQLIGGNGADVYYVDDAGDVTVELANEGVDTVYASLKWTLSTGVENLVMRGVIVAGTGNGLGNFIAGNTAANSIKGLGGNDTMDGAAANDTLDGGDGADLLSGAAGADSLLGGAGNDTLLGGAGNDVFSGGAGNDLLSGGLGADRFNFNSAVGNGNVDHILTFTTGSDVVALDDAIFAGLATGTLAATRFALGAAATDSADRIVYDVNTGSLYYDADGNGAAAQVLFAVLDDRAALSAADFSVV